jgi:L-ascorbate metabolism protein UlaG (beta-lactamase superfamily)
MNFHLLLRPRAVSSAGAVMLIAALVSACMNAPKMPAVDGAVIEVRRSGRSLTERDANFNNTLQLYWFGSGCHLIQLGGLCVLIDPFVTNGVQITDVRSDPRRVEATLARIPPPDVVLINHAHIDHLLDAHAALTLPDWRKAEVPLFGGRTSVNILAGWRDEEMMSRCHAIREGEIIDRRLDDGGELRVIAYRSKHAPHLGCGHTFFDGAVPEPRATPPRNIGDFKTGEVFNYLVTLKRGDTTFRVFCLGGATDLDEFPNSIPPEGTRIDVAILCAPGAKNVEGYPERHLARLRPRHIVLSHFNTFLKEDPDAQLTVAGIDVARVDKFSRDIQSVFTRNPEAYPEFERLHIPALTVMEAHNRARNVITIR